MALVLGSVDLLLLPYGTALGIYTLWLLLSEQGKGALRAPNVSALRWVHACRALSTDRTVRRV